MNMITFEQRTDCDIRLNCLNVAQQLTKDPYLVLIKAQEIYDWVTGKTEIETRNEFS